MPDTTLPQKQCRSCGMYRYLDNYVAMPSMKDGLHATCRHCDNARRRQQYYENHSRELAAAARNRPRRAEINKEYSRRYRETNKERVKAAIQEWRQINKDRVLELNRAYAQRNREKVRKFGQVRYANRKGNGGSFTKDEWNELCAIFGNVCVCCGRAGRLTIDHIIPIVAGGTSNIENLQPLCKTCNCRKGSRLIIDYRLPWKVVSGRDMKGLVHHRRHGAVARHIVSVDMLRAAA